METNTDEIPTFEEAYKEGEVLEKNGYHDVSKDRGHPYKNQSQKCECYIEMTDSGGVYRRVKIRLDDKEIYYYHQAPVYMKYDNGTFTLAKPRYKKTKVKKTIQDALPGGYNLKELRHRRNQKPQRRTWFITEPKFDSDVYGRNTSGAEEANKEIKITKSEQVVKNL